MHEHNAVCNSVTAQAPSICTGRVSRNSNFRGLTFAGLDAFDPCVIEFCVADITTVLEPRATSSTTAAVVGLLNGTALGTHLAAYCGRVRHHRLRGCFGGHTKISIINGSILAP